MLGSNSMISLFGKSNMVEDAEKARSDEMAKMLSPGFLAMSRMVCLLKH